MVDYRIRTFLTLYETMNYRKTGEALCLSQPAVSQQIRGLEEKYGCKLFVYDGRKLSATPQAHRVAEYARRLERLRIEYFQAAGRVSAFERHAEGRAGTGREELPPRTFGRLFFESLPLLIGMIVAALIVAAALLLSFL